MGTGSPHREGLDAQDTEQICLAEALREGGRRRNRPMEARPDALGTLGRGLDCYLLKATCRVWRSERDKDRCGSEDNVLDLV